MKIVTMSKYRTCSICTPQEDATLETMLELMEDILRANGYVFEGNLDIIEDIPNA